MSGRLKVLTLLLGVWMFMFGFLKFFQPIGGWFDVQFQQSHLPHQLILPGKVSEMVVGFLFLLPWLRKIAHCKKQRSDVVDRVLHPRYSDVRRNLRPPAARGAC